MSDWTECHLGEIASMRRGIGYTDATMRMRPDQGLPYLNMKSFVKDGGYNREGLKYFAGSYSRGDMALSSDVLIANTDVTPTGDIIGVPALLPPELGKSGALFSHHVTRVRPTPRVVPEFLHFALCSQPARRAMLRIARGTTVLMLDASALKRVPIRFPSDTREQQRIAAILSSLDDAMEATEALIEKHQQIKVGLMRDLFTCGAVSSGQLRQRSSEEPELFQATALGPLPREWRRSTVGESFEIDSGITLGPHRRPARRPRRYLRVANVHRDQLRLDDVASIETLPGDDGYVLRQGDLLVVEGHANPAEIGRCAMVDQDAAGMLFQNHLFRMRTNEIDRSFALLWLNSFHVQRYWERTCSTSSGLHTINRRMLKAVPMFVPSQAEQSRIVSAAASARTVLDGHINVLAKLRAQKLGLMQDLLTGKVRVPLPEPEVTA